MIKDLDKSSKYDKSITISADKEDITLLTGGLEYFIDNPKSFLIADFLSEDELLEFSNDCKEIRKELESFL